MVSEIISGGQTGADRAGVDVAIALNLDYGGYLPKGRLTEDGPLDEKYSKMTELDTKSYPVRTKKNILTADATVIFTMGKLGRGSALTIKYAKEYNKPYVHIDLMFGSPVSKLKTWLEKVQPQILNVAGSRESSAPGIYEKVFNILYHYLYCRNTPMRFKKIVLVVPEAMMYSHQAEPRSVYCPVNKENLMALFTTSSYSGKSFFFENPDDIRIMSIEDTQETRYKTNQFDWSDDGWYVTEKSNLRYGCIKVR